MASTGILVALIAAASHYLAASPSPRLGVVNYLAPVWPIAFTAAAVILAVALVTGRARYAAHVLAAACMSTYAVALWGTALIDTTTRGVTTAGLATALAIHALLLATVYSRGGAGWTQN